MTMTNGKKIALIGVVLAITIAIAITMAITRSIGIVMTAKLRAMTIMSTMEVATAPR